MVEDLFVGLFLGGFNMVLVFVMNFVVFEFDLFFGEEYIYLFIFVFLFELDYFEMFVILCDVFIDCYMRFLNFILMFCECLFLLVE